MNNPADLLTELGLQPLPDAASELLQRFNAPPRLIAHLILVHDVATQILASIQKLWPTVAVDTSAVLLGSALHDIGKIRYPDELIGPGHQHEGAGVALLLDAGIAPSIARFAETHAQWATRPDISLEDLVVALADNCWKGKRNATLEAKFVELLAAATNQQQWEIFLTFDTLVERLAKGADGRLAWQSQFAAK